MKRRTRSITRSKSRSRTRFAVLLFLLGAGGALGYFFLPNNIEVSPLDRSRLNLLIEDRVISEGREPQIVNEEILLPVDTVKKHIDNNIYWDDKADKVTITTKDKLIRMKTDSLNALVNNKPVTLSLPVSKIENTVYVPIEFLSDFYGIDIDYVKKANVIIIDYSGREKKFASPVKKKAVIRKDMSRKEPIIKKLDTEKDSPEELKLKVFEEHEKWFKVRAFDGSVGYIEKSFVELTETTPAKLPEEKEAVTAWKPEKGRINMAWDAIYKNTSISSKMQEVEGLDVLSPTFFEIEDASGTVLNKVNSGYIKWAHSKGYKVWALLSNDFGSIEDTGKLLNDTDARDNVIRQILAYAALYKLDGINIDFENVYKRDKDALTQFVREITPLLHEQGLTVSVDVNVPDGSDNYSLCYDRKALAEIVDYVMLMAYDQHWSTSPKAGSVSQITWVESKLEKTLTEVPAEKLILGVPFYTRLWKEEKGSDGNIKVSSSNGLFMDAAKNNINENNARVSWEEESGQFYAEYVKDGIRHRLWLEDENSINLRASLVLKYNLAGTSVWSKDASATKAWETLRENLKDISDYQEWLEKNKDKQYIYE